MNERHLQNDFHRSFSRMSRESFFRENFRVNGTEFEATGIEEILESTKLAMGGALATATTTLRVTDDTYRAAGLAKGLVVQIGDDLLRILTQSRDNVGNWTLHLEAANTGGSKPSLR